jgi:hypothetical protein
MRGDYDRHARRAMARAIADPAVPDPGFRAQNLWITL